MQSRAVKIVEGGKLIIPAAFRREMEIGVGDTVVVELLEGELRVRSRRSDFRRLQDRVRRIGKAEGGKLVPSAPELKIAENESVTNG